MEPLTGTGRVRQDEGPQTSAARSPSGTWNAKDPPSRIGKVRPPRMCLDGDAAVRRELPPREGSVVQANPSDRVTGHPINRFPEARFPGKDQGAPAACCWVPAID